MGVLDEINFLMPIGICEFKIMLLVPSFLLKSFPSLYEYQVLIVIHDFNALT